jgi:membrane protein implicated in regulation of membrane protease activity
MSGWVAWVIAACAFSAGEMVTKRFVLAPFALGGGAAAITAGAGAGELASWVVFVIVSLLTLGVLRPVARARTRTPPSLRAGSGGLVGKQAIVLERIANHEGVGCVKIDGEIWTARASDDGHVIDSGTRVEVVAIKGATALVTD